MIKDKSIINEDEERYVLTEQALMQLTLNDFKIDVSLPMAKAIYEAFMECMMKAGYIDYVGDEKEEKNHNRKL